MLSKGAGEGDLAKLVGSYPAFGCFQGCGPVVDGLDLIRSAGVPFAAKSPPGLSDVCRLLLGAKHYVSGPAVTLGTYF